MRHRPSRTHLAGVELGVGGPFHSDVDGVDDLGEELLDDVRGGEPVGFHDHVEAAFLGYRGGRQGPFGGDGGFVDPELDVLVLAATVSEDEGVVLTAAVRERRRPRPGVRGGALVVMLAV